MFLLIDSIQYEIDLMLLTNLEIVPGKRITKHLGLVQGSSVRAKHVGRDIMAGLKSIVGGELKEYSEMLSEARAVASDRMVSEAKQKSADAIINIRFTTSQVMNGAAEIMVFGTAVKVE